MSQHFLKSNFLLPKPFSTFTWHSINRILNEECLRVQQVYIIFDVLFSSLRYLAEVLFLATIYTYLIPRSILATASHPSQGARKKSPPVLLLHLVLCSVLALFWLFMIALTLAYVIQSLFGGGLVSTLGLIDGTRKLIFVFYLFYFLAAVEILALAVLALMAARSKGNSKVPQRGRKTPLLFLTTITLPLLIRTTWQLAITATYNLRDLYYSPPEPEKVNLAQQLFYYACTVVVFAGLVSVMVVMVREEEEEEVVNGEREDGMVGGVVEGARVGRERGERDHSQDMIYNGP
ncbi:MAG: hypothetical protein Q9186_005007 [Xanthomendoza sp. 1 TL-2023]